MEIYKCIEKKKDNHGKYNYTLLDTSGDYINISSDDLKHKP